MNCVVSAYCYILYTVAGFQNAEEVVRPAHMLYLLKRHSSRRARNFLNSVLIICLSFLLCRRSRAVSFYIRERESCLRFFSSRFDIFDRRSIYDCALAAAEQSAAIKTSIVSIFSILHLHFIASLFHSDDRRGSDSSGRVLRNRAADNMHTHTHTYITLSGGMCASLPAFKIHALLIEYTLALLSLSLSFTPNCSPVYNSTYTLFPREPARSIILKIVSVSREFRNQ